MLKRFIPESILIFICFVWGVTFVVVQDAIKSLPPYSFLAARFFVSFLVLLIVNKLYFREKMGNRADIKSGIIVGFFLFIGFALQTFSLLYTTSGKSGFFTGMNVAFVPVVAFLFFRHPIKLPALLGIINTIIGMYFLSGSIVGMNLGDVLALACALAFAIQIALTGHFAQQVSPYSFVIWQLFVVTICSSVMSVSLETFHPSVFLKPVVWTGILITAILATVFAFVAQTIIQQKVNATRVAIIFTLEPVFAALGDYVVNGITLSTMEVIGCLIIMGGILLAEIPWKEGRKLQLSDETRIKIWRTVNNLSDDQLNQQESIDQWSIAQILQHLYSVENHIAKRLETVIMEETPKPQAKPLQLTLDRSDKVKSSSSPSNEFRTLASLKQKLEESRVQINRIIQSIPTVQLEQKSMTHPVFGEAMSLLQWIEFIDLHEQRHLEQIKEVITNLGL